MDKKQPEAQQATCTNSDSWNCKYCNKTKTCAALAAGQATAAQAAAPIKTLTEAIAHAEDKAKGNSACAMEHAKLAAWLTELQLLRAALTTPQPTQVQPIAQAAEPVAWLDPWTGTKVTTDYDAYGKHGIPLYTAPQPVAREPLTPEQIQDLLLCGNPTDEEMRLIRIGWDAANGIKGANHD